VDFLSSLSSRNQPLLTRVRRQVAANCPRLPSRDGNLRSHDCKDATLIRHLNILTKGQVTIQFRIRASTSIRTIDVNSPIGKVQFYIIKADTPFLLCLADIDRLYIKYNNLKNVIITYTKRVPVVRQFGHLFLL